jgi:hypothetical protein
MQAELQLRRHTEVASSTSEPPEKLGLLILACAHHRAVGSDDLGAEQVVACQTVLRGEVTDSAAKGQAGHAGGADNTARSDQPEGLCRRVEIEPCCTALGERDLRAGLDVDPAHH